MTDKIPWLKLEGGDVTEVARRLVDDPDTEWTVVSIGLKVTLEAADPATGRKCQIRISKEAAQRLFGGVW